MAITSCNVMGECPESGRVVLRLWGDSELEVRAAALRGAAALCDASWSAYEDHPGSPYGPSADVVHELPVGSSLERRTAVAETMRAYARRLQVRRGVP